MSGPLFDMRAVAALVFLALCVASPTRAVEGAEPSADFIIGTDAGRALPPEITRAVARIEAGPLRAHIAWLADPRREGRGLGSAGLDAATEYVAARLEAAGVSPLGEGPARPSWFQEVPLREIRAQGGELTLSLPDAGAAIVRSWRAGVDCVLPEVAPQVITGPVVFAGFGIREPDLGHDDFDGLDVRGKIVIFVGGLPPGPAWQTPELADRYAFARPEDRYDVRLALLEKLGARAAIAIEEGLEERLRARGGKVDPYLIAAAAAPERTLPPLVRVTPDLAALLFPRVGLDPARPRAYRPEGIAGATASIRVAGEVRPAVSRNVIGMLAGADARLRDEAVIIGAHLDHLGMSGGQLYPGADDNASGVAAVLEMARSFAASRARPRRTLVFAFWTGEEAGHFGSDHYVRNPRWPLARTSVYVNLDMIAHPWTRAGIRELVTAAGPDNAGRFLAEATPANFAEPGIAASAPWLGDALSVAAHDTGMTLHLDRTDGRDGGSDYRGFARRDLPFIRFFGNYFPGYHDTGDTPGELDPAQVERMARLVFATAWLLADR